MTSLEKRSLDSRMVANGDERREVAWVQVVECCGASLVIEKCFFFVLTACNPVGQPGIYQAWHTEVEVDGD